MDPIERLIETLEGEKRHAKQQVELATNDTDRAWWLGRSDGLILALSHAEVMVVKSKAEKV